MSDTQGVQLTFSEDEINAIYSELIHLSVPLDADPVAFGPKRLNAKIAEVRRMLDRVHRIYLDLSQRHGAVKRHLRKATASLDIQKKNLFANDPETRAGRNVADREAIATGKLRVEVEEVNRLQILEADLESLLIVVKAKHADLKDTESRLRDQVRLCGEELSLGGRWGSAVPNAPDLDPRVATGADVKEIDNLLASLNSQIDLAQKAGDFPSMHIQKMTPEDEPAAPPEPVSEAVPVPEQTYEPVVEVMSDILNEPPSKNIEEVFPLQVSQSAADAFLDSAVVAPVPSTPQAPKSNPLDKVSDGLDIEDLLISFEDPNG